MTNKLLFGSWFVAFNCGVGVVAALVVSATFILAYTGITTGILFNIWNVDAFRRGSDIFTDISTIYFAYYVVPLAIVVDFRAVFGAILIACFAIGIIDTRFARSPVLISDS